MTIDYSQPSILAALPVLGRSLTFRIAPYADPRSALRRLRDGFALDWGVIGVGEPVVRALGQEVEGLRVFPGLAGPACSVPSTQQGLWCFLRGQDRGALFDITEQIQSFLDEAFVLDDMMDTFSMPTAGTLPVTKMGRRTPGVTPRMTRLSSLPGTT